MSSVASTRSDFASCATSSPSSRSGLGETTTSSPAATAIRSVSAATPSGPAPKARGQLLAPGHLDARRDERRRGRQRLVELVDAVQQVAELEAPEHLLQLRAVRRREHDLGRVEVELEVAPHRRELLRGLRLLGVLADRLRAGRRQLVHVLEHVLQRAVLGDQLAGRLVADAGNARDVVGGVALQADEVRHLLGLDPEAQLDPLGRVDVDVGDAARGHHQRDVVAHELEGVAVGRDDRRLDPGLVGAVGERGDHVVGLPALELEVAVAERLDDRPEVRELLPQQVRHRLALDLVGLELLGPVHGPRVPGDRDAPRPVVGEQLEEHVGEAEQRVGGEALARGELLGQRVEGAVGEVVPVDEEEVGVARRAVVELELLSRQRLRRHLCESTSHGRARDRPLFRRASGRRGGPAGGPSRAPSRGRAAASGATSTSAREVEREWRQEGASGVFAGSAYLFAAPLHVRGTTWMRVGIAGQAIEGDREPMRDLYAVAGQRWVDEGLTEARRLRPVARRRARRRLVQALVRCLGGAGDARDRAEGRGAVRRRRDDQARRRRRTSTRRRGSTSR